MATIKVEKSGVIRAVNKGDEFEIFKKAGWNEVGKISGEPIGPVEAAETKTPKNRKDKNAEYGDN